MGYDETSFSSWAPTILCSLEFMMPYWYCSRKLFCFYL